MAGAAALALRPFARLSFRIVCKREETDERFTFEVTAFWGLYRYRLRAPDAVVGRLEKEESGECWKEMKDGYGVAAGFAWLSVIMNLLRWSARFLTRYRRALLYLWERLRVTSLAWHTVIGTGDPATTGVAAGLLWSFKAYLLARLGGRLRSSGTVFVAPDFLSPL